MPRSVTLDAPAKVNLHLQVLARRPDGYHDLVSLFHAVSLADTVTLCTAGPAEGFRLEGRFDLPSADNLVTRAVEAFRAETGVRDGIAATVEKRIPAGSGMGGGSSDAAAVLRGLEALFATGLAPRRLRALAAALGSDVPFFLESPAALVEGRGERVQPVSPRRDFALVAVLTGLAVRTADAFGWIDEDRAGGAVQRAGEPAAISREGLLRVWEGQPPAQWGFRNDFDGPVLGRFPALRAARDGLLAAGASRAGLTGSGSAVIGICPGAREADACLRAFVAAARGVSVPRAEVLIPLASLPVICYN